MKRLMILALGGAVFAAPLYAALAPGAQAPVFTTEATLAGKPCRNEDLDKVATNGLIHDELLSHLREAVQ